MVRVEETRALGVHCGGKCCPLFTILLASIGLGASLAYTLVTRIYIHGYYSSAHVAGLLVFLTLFVITHHVMRVRPLLGCGPRAYIFLQCVLNVWHLVCCTTLAIAYTILSAFSALPSLDYVAAAAWGWTGVLFILYLTAVSLAATRGNWYSSYDLATTRTSFVYHAAKDLPMKELSLKDLSAASHSSKVSLVTSTTSLPEPRCHSCKTCCKTCCRVTFRSILWFFYTVFHLVFAVVITLSAYHPCAVLDDWRLYLPTEDLYSVSVGGHRPMLLYLRCRGKGNDTIVYENGLGGMSAMAWHYLPRFLEEENFRVCLHDRRSYGWSQGLENDFLPNIKDKPQWAETNTAFFRALLQEAGISGPFYYVGHSYGGLHIAYTAILYPDLIKGLVFLDSDHFSVISEHSWLAEVAANFFPTGLTRILLDCGLGVDVIMGDLPKLDTLPRDLRLNLLAQIRSGEYFTGLLREYKYLTQPILEPYIQNGESLDDYPAVLLRRLLERSPPVDKPVLVVDAGRNSSAWFPEQYFPQYNSSFQAYIPEASHSGLVYTNRYANLTAQLIAGFVRVTESVDSLQHFSQLKLDVGAL